MTSPRASGILLHPTSLPGRFGIGDLGDEAYRFIDWLADAGQSYWQILPLGPTGYGDSPYQSFSAFAGNTLLISPVKLFEDGLLEQSDIAPLDKSEAGKVDYGKVIEYKDDLLQKAFARFCKSDDLVLAEMFRAFCHANKFWLEDYALFRAIKSSQGQVSWQNWDKPLKLREPEALQTAALELADQIQEQKFYQFIFFKQWNALKSYANQKGVKIVGDIPIFVAMDSCDVWCNPGQFKLNKDGSPKVVAGVPPDYFSKTGQLWGNPIYDWDEMLKDGFRWWIERVRYTLKTVDIIRIDHFRGFTASWEVPGEDETAENGKWVNVPGKQLFMTLRHAVGRLVIIAEDLGDVTQQVTELRDSFGFPGMRILQFAWGGDAGNQDLPHNYVKNCVVYTGTHDNDTTIGWWNSKAGAGSGRSAEQIKKERSFCKQYLRTNGKEIHWDFIQAVMASAADTAIIPMQDVLGLGNEARMNLPGSTIGNWQWRCSESNFSVRTAKKLKTLAELYGRATNLK